MHVAVKIVDGKDATLASGNSDELVCQGQLRALHIPPQTLRCLHHSPCPNQSPVNSSGYEYCSSVRDSCNRRGAESEDDACGDVSSSSWRTAAVAEAVEAAVSVAAVSVAAVAVAAVAVAAVAAL